MKFFLRKKSCILKYSTVSLENIPFMQTYPNPGYDQL